MIVVQKKNRLTYKSETNMKPGSSKAITHVHQSNIIFDYECMHCLIRNIFPAYRQSSGSQSKYYWKDLKYL